MSYSHDVIHAENKSSVSSSKQPSVSSKKDTVFCRDPPPTPGTGVMNKITLETRSHDLIVLEWEQRHLNWSCIRAGLEGSSCPPSLQQPHTKAHINVLHRKSGRSACGAGLASDGLFDWWTFSDII